MPSWYPIVRAARYLGVAPWDLETHEAGPWWTLVALASERAEAHAEKMQAGR